jgi:hypothetical protein
MHMIRKILKKILGIIFSRSLRPPTEEEIGFLKQLQDEFRNLDVSISSNALPSEAVWLGNMKILRHLVLSQDPRSFLRWDVVSHTMFVTYASYIAAELRFLKERSDWNARWRRAVKESLVGLPIRYVFYPASSGNLIHHAYHVAQFEEKTKIQVETLDFVFEFGGGYGSMCRLFHNLGFKGEYIIFDLPAFSSLQRYFLRASGFPVQSAAHDSDSKAGIKCVSDVILLKALLRANTEPRKSLFLATWSISEAPVVMRGEILPLVSEFQSFLIAYQDKFEEVDNIDFFDDWKNGRGNVIWHNWRMKHTPGNSYLIGSVANELSIK